MTIETPVLRLGLAGFTEAQYKAATDSARAATAGRASWEIGSFTDADAWWLEGSRTVLLPNGMLRVQPGVISGRSVQLALADVDRPVAFTLPLAAAGFQPAVTFPLDDKDRGVAVLNQFTSWMHPVVAQFCLGSSLVEHQPTLASGSWEVLHGADLLAVVDLRLGAGVDPKATASDFAGASWCIRDHGAVVIPPEFPRVSVSHLMWQYALRTRRDLLPPHYRSQPLYFRRPPRITQRQIKDAHLLLLRELAAKPGRTFEQLQQSTGIPAGPLGGHLSALYVVGSITANPKRALGGMARRPEDEPGGSDSSSFNSDVDPAGAASQFLRRPVSDLTAPAPLLPEGLLRWS
jgi:hypothetical protein